MGGLEMIAVCHESGGSTSGISFQTSKFLFHAYKVSLKRFFGGEEYVKIIQGTNSIIITNTIHYHHHSHHLIIQSVTIFVIMTHSNRTSIRYW